LEIVVKYHSPHLSAAGTALHSPPIVGSYNKCLFIACLWVFKGILEPQMKFGYRLTSFFGFITFSEDTFLKENLKTA